MRIALCHPTYWPEVRRGSERLAHDLAVSLADRDHEVTLIASHPGGRAESIEDGVRVIRTRRVPRLPGLSWYDEHIDAAPALFADLVRGEYELVHALYPVDGWVARHAQRMTGTPYVLSIHGVLNREYLVRRRQRLEMLSSAATGAAAVSVLSPAAAEPMHRFALAEPVILPGGVIGSDYDGPISRPAVPTLLCPAALEDPRKRGELLFEAFGRLREQLGELELVLAGGGSAPTAVEGVRIDVPASTEELAVTYRSSSVTVLPSDDEAFGLVLIESLAAGTPVVASRAGGCVEIVTDERVGRLFEPGDADDMARALIEAIKLAADPKTAERCRKHARLWDWAEVVERYEAVYELVAS